jgi:hypothetical protein
MTARGWDEESVFAVIRNPASEAEARDIRHSDDGSGETNDEPARAYITDDVNT